MASGQATPDHVTSDLHSLLHSALLPLTFAQGLDLDCSRDLDPLIGPVEATAAFIDHDFDKAVRLHSHSSRACVQLQRIRDKHIRSQHLCNHGVLIIIIFYMYVLVSFVKSQTWHVTCHNAP